MTALEKLEKKWIDSYYFFNRQYDRNTRGRKGKKRRAMFSTMAHMYLHCINDLRSVIEETNQGE